MLAVIYFALAACVGDFFCRRFYQFASFAHRCAAAILIGLLISSWFTYLAGLAFFWTSEPLVWANLLFLLAAIAVLSWPKWKGKIIKHRPGKTRQNQTDLYLPRPKGSGIADWLLIIGYLVLVSWMMFASFNTKGGKLQIANPEYSDFGPNTALMQSFAVGHNFPTEYPHFSGDRIRYHFLFYFQAGNLEFLGLNPAWSLNILSITTLVAMLVVVMTLGEVLFNSRAVGRVGSLLFFFFGSLSYVPFLHKQASVRAAIQTITHQRDYLQTIFPYRGEAWGTWSQVTYLNQRHFASGIGILLLVLVFLVIRYRAVLAKPGKLHRFKTHLANLTRLFAGRRRPGSIARHPKLETACPQAVSIHDGAPGDALIAEPNPASETATDTVSDNLTRSGAFSAIIATGGGFSLGERGGFAHRSGYRSSNGTNQASRLQIGKFPCCTARVHFLWCPSRVTADVEQRRISMPQRQSWDCCSSYVPNDYKCWGSLLLQGVIALPQMLFLSTGAGRAHMPKLLHWGYTIDHPTAMNVRQVPWVHLWLQVVADRVGADFRHQSAKALLSGGVKPSCRCLLFPIHHRGPCQPKIHSYLGDHRESLRRVCALAALASFAGRNHVAGKVCRDCCLPPHHSRRHHRFLSDS